VPVDCNVRYDKKFASIQPFTLARNVSNRLSRERGAEPLTFVGAMLADEYKNLRDVRRFLFRFAYRLRHRVAGLQDLARPRD